MKRLDQMTPSAFAKAFAAVAGPPSLRPPCANDFATIPAAATAQPVRPDGFLGLTAGERAAAQTAVEKLREKLAGTPPPPMFRVMPEPLL